jgi:ribosomal protein S18 acetylase RimI-like enzyme
MRAPELEVIEVEPHSSALRRSIELYMGEKKTLGFMPDTGFSERAAAGRLLAAADAEQICGYVLFDLRSDRVKVRHLCVAPSARREGVARFLVDALRARHPDKRAIVAECRRDYGLHGMWRSLGFTPVHERPGRGFERRPLTVWVLEQGLPDLFTDFIERDERELASVDHNILEDLVNPRPQGAQTEALLEDWVTELVELAATDENLHEVERGDEPAHRQRLRAQLTHFRRLSPRGEEWEPFRDRVAGLIPAAGYSDCCHLARAVAARARYFITRDQDILDGARAIEREMDILIVRPEELISRLDRLRAADRYEPAALQGTGIVDCPADEIDQERLVRTFLNYGPETRGQFLKILRDALASPHDHSARAFVAGDGRLLGLVVRVEHPDWLEVKLLRVSGTDRLATAVARQLSYAQREYAAGAELRSVVVSDPTPPRQVEDFLPEEGYRRFEDGWNCHIAPAIVVGADLPELRQGAGGPQEAALFERERWPLKIVGAGIPVFIVPIKPRWAEELFDTGLAERTLFDRQTSLGLAREHVYYRRPRNHRNMQPPARILWYVSANRDHPVGHVRAVSQLAEVVVGRPLTLYRRFSRLGVFTEAEVRNMGDAQGRVMALRFVDTELLHRPLDVDTLRDIWANHGRRFTPPPSPQPVSEEVFAEMYREGSTYPQGEEFHRRHRNHGT